MMGRKLPENWVETELGNITKSIKGKKPKILSDTEFKDSVPYFDIRALEHNDVRQYADIDSSRLTKKGDIAIVWDGARSGWVSKTSSGGATGSTIALIRAKLFNTDYLFHYLSSIYPYINSMARGVGIPHVDPTVLWNMQIPLPPLAEQERIVAKLDTLFAQLDAMRKSMHKIPTLLKNFRQQVLTQAVTGKLTEEWRDGKELEEWRETSISNISDSKSGYAFKSDDFINEGMQVVRMGNLYNNKLDLSRNPVYLPFSYEKSIIERSRISINDILLTLTGTKYKRDYGYAIKVEEDGLLLNQRILALTPNINTDFFLYLLSNC